MNVAKHASSCDRIQKCRIDEICMKTEIANSNRRCAHMKLTREAMNTRVKLTHPQDTIANAASAMKEFEVGMMPVVDNDKVVGAITDRDIVCRGVADNKDLTQTRVSDIMTRDVNACYDDQGIDEVAQTMKANKVRRVIVLNREDQLAGVISLGDLAGHTHVETSGDVLRKVAEPGDTPKR
ncbi:CBS domain-containing protein [candidate division GN15 bacterium]|nr:CBS domain-containing protein [candidate division GN15 bacterium]